MPYYIQKPSRGKNWRIRGTHYEVTVDRSSGTPVKAEAEEVARSWERQAYETQVLGKRPPHPFHAAVVDYINAGGEELWLKPLVEHFGERDVRHLNQSDLDAAARKLHRGVADSTKRRRVHTPFIAIMNLAADNGHCDHRKWRRPKQPEGRTDWRTPDEIEKLLAELRPNMQALCTYIVACFPRVTETLDMLRRDVIGDRAIYWGESTKGGYTRHVELPERAKIAVAHAMKRDAEPDDYLWVSDLYKEPYHHYMAINQTLKRACKRAKIKHLSVHTLRHTGATWRYSVTKDLTHVMVQGGWKSLDMVQRYVHAGSDDLAKKVTSGNWCI